MLTDSLGDPMDRISSALTTATTRTATAAVVGPPDRGHLVAPEVIASAHTNLRYRIERLLGEGGFGQVYLATRLGRSTSVPEVVCIKVSARIDGWLREAYFGQLLDGHPRAIRVFDAFPLMRADGHVLYCLALEYARHGDLSAFLAARRQRLVRSRRRGARSPASSRCSASCIAARRSTAISRR